MTRTTKSASLFLVFFLILTLCAWWQTREIKIKWPGVPPVPEARGATAMTLGDNQFSYRIFALTLQNLGDTGGDVTPLQEYDYQKLKHWFWLAHALDPVANHVPMIAAYYFGATRKPEDIRVVVDYLAVAGKSNIGEKWRWLAHAVFLARHRLNDLDYALRLARDLAAVESKDRPMPAWTKQMPAFVYKAQGDREAARDIMLAILATDQENMHPNEINFMLAYLEEQLGYNLEDLGIVKKTEDGGQKTK